MKRHESIMDAIVSAQRWRKQQGYEAAWQRFVDAYKGKYYPPGLQNTDRLVSNIVFANVNVLVPAIAVNNPKVVVNGVSVDDGDQAVIAEAVVNYLWRHYGYQREIMRAVKDMVIFGHGVAKVYWRFEERERRITPDEMDAAAMAAEEQISQAAAADPMMADQLPGPDDIRSTLPRTVFEVVHDAPCVERVSPFDMLFDPEAPSLNDVKWVAQRVIRPVEQVRNDKRFNSRVREKVEADTSAWVDDVADREERKRANKIASRASYWEFYDVVSGTMSIVCSEGFLVAPRPMPYMFGHPFCFILNHEVPDSLYPIGDVEPILPLQEELNKIRTLQMNARKHYGRKYLYYEHAFGPEGRAALSSNVDGAFVPVADGTRPLSDVVQPFPYVPINAEIFNMSRIVEDDITLVSGVTDYARGSMPERTRTATEASILADAYNSRAADKLSRVEGLMSAVARKVIQLCQQFMTGEQTARIMGPQGERWFSYTAADIRGEFDFSVEAGSSQPMNETVRRQTAVAMLNTLAPMIGTVIDPVAIAEHALKYGFGVRETDKFILKQQGPQPMGAPVDEPMARESTQGIPLETLDILTNGASQTANQERQSPWT